MSETTEPRAEDQVLPLSESYELKLQCSEKGRFCLVLWLRSLDPIRAFERKSCNFGKQLRRCRRWSLWCRRYNMICRTVVGIGQRGYLGILRNHSRRTLKDQMRIGELLLGHFVALLCFWMSCLEQWIQFRPPLKHHNMKRKKWITNVWIKFVYTNNVWKYTLFSVNLPYFTG